MEKRPDTHNLLMSAYRMGGQGGAQQIAERLGKTKRTVFNELNPQNHQHKLGLLDSALYQLITGRFDVLRDYAAVLGHIATPVADFSGISDIELLNAYSDWTGSLARVHESISRALSDRRITRQEFQEIQMELNRSMAVGLEFIFRVEAVIDESA